MKSFAQWYGSFEKCCCFSVKKCIIILSVFNLLCLAWHVLSIYIIPMDFLSYFLAAFRLIAAISGIIASCFSNNCAAKTLWVIYLIMIIATFLHMLYCGYFLTFSNIYIFGANIECHAGVVQCDRFDARSFVRLIYFMVWAEVVVSSVLLIVDFWGSAMSYTYYKHLKQKPQPK